MARRKSHGHLVNRKTDPMGIGSQNKKTTMSPEKIMNPRFLSGWKPTVESLVMFILGGFPQESYSTLARARNYGANNAGNTQDSQEQKKEHHDLSICQVRRFEMMKYSFDVDDEMIPEPGDPDREVPVNETFHEQTDEELTEKELKQVEADDQAIQTILLGLPEDIYAAVDSCETAQEIWLRVQQMMKGSDIGIQEKKAKLFNEWERFTSTDGESIESYYHRFSKLMNDFKRNKHFPEKIASNLKFLNNLQPEWSRHVTIVHQTKDLHTADYTQLYDFLKYNQKEIAQPGMNLGQDRQMQMVGVQNVKNQVVQNAVQNPGIQNVRNQNGLIVVPGIANQNANQIGNAAVGDLDEIEEVNANCILMANLQQASTSGTQIDKAPVYDSDGSAKAHEYDNCYNKEIFNTFTQEEQYTELLDPIPEPYQVQQNDSNVISAVSSVEQSEGTVEQHPATAEETRALYDSLYNNLAIEVEKVKTVNHKIKETNADLTTELLRYKNQEKCFEINQEKYDKLERCYQKYVYQEQCLTKKINALHLSFAKTITTLNEKISNLNNQLSKEKSIVSSLQEEKKKLKSDFKMREDELIDKQIQFENKIKELDNILVKMGQSIQTMPMLSVTTLNFHQCNIYLLY
ncbi:hypothetical protein Tco_0715493 [Tanacetum coccineum]